MCLSGKGKQFCLALIISSAMISGGGVIGWSVQTTKLSSDPTGKMKLTLQDEDWLVGYAGIGGLISTILTVGLIDMFGPCRLLHFFLLPSAITWILMATLESEGELIAGRIFSGFFLQLSTIIIYPLLSEMSEKNVRGSFLCLPDILFSSGHLLMNIFARFLTWQNGTLITGILMFPVIGLYFYVPESPYWYIRKGKYKDAVRSLKRIRSAGHDCETEMKSLKEVLVDNCDKPGKVMDQISNLKYPENYRPTLLLCLLIILREFGGSLALFLYAPFFFKSAGINLSVFMIVVLIGFTKIMFSFVASAIIDVIGRRNLFLSSSITCCFTMFIIGYIVQYPSSLLSWVPLISLIIFVASFGLGIGPMPWILIGEILPTPVRFVSSSIACALFTLLFYLECYFLPTLVQSLSLGRMAIAFAFFNLILNIVIWMFLPETRNRSLEELQTAFVGASLRPFKNQRQGYIQPYGSTFPARTKIISE
ncbi:Facilitated trehalose transporter Tret1 [Armadillidium vulgare]|nr:Facilitated trehalose transporter Tret1 [Armadillidium vulgare]